MESGENIDSITVDDISGIARALSEPVRVRMLMCLKGGPLSLYHFTEIFKMAPSTLSKHLHILESAGLLVAVRHGRWRLYQWQGQDAEQTIRALLAWLGQAVLKDPVLEDDAARRAVAVQATPVPVPQNDIIRVLFLCSGNSCRSQMAEALLSKRAGPAFEVSSAGTAPREIPPLTVTVMDEIGIDIRDQKPKSVMEYIGTTYFDYLITVCPMAEQQTPVFPGVSRRLHWPVPDPAEEAKGSEEEKKQVFRQVRDLLDEKIQDWLKQSGLRQEAGNKESL
ncbi:thioredoxin type arsenate reductase [Desulfosalsimonas propionicica]|uniref:Thioredoxin type arsenate reductase n=1 Tax=Desulfosalsimonas propionicica TaxID=332175 RepID=A0A7W0CA41_9BACT|nr:metalloregulator ArsR/SmtB family transcription factor [Desulfosalsimonas propionicica]MBA2881859.1 thioredoxin type arsenate reductase [Desulfosalsimonas propionicica]